MSAARFAHAVEVVAARRTGQDRAAVVAFGDTLLVALADGAGGTGNGDVAAQAIVDAVVAAGPTADACALLAELDGDGPRLGHGQSTAVIVAITAAGITGAGGKLQDDVGIVLCR